MTQSQKKLNVNVSFEGELAQYLTEVAEAWSKTIPEVLVYLVKEEFEAEKEMAEIIKERDVPGAKTVAHEDVDWGDDVES
ncbi:hypothetical protein [Wolbachia endosymbiont of Drosophila pseudotakahashii]|uniref:hypothetical protein n=1 Tax=Wolbachia endosymbiont of Drosophila pseudotakahashii TaxID=375919 RepID=UPI00222EC579|nr:hypothetical protein [Wolbachia endosymbiont of Drosophila pseudotakahashii]MCX3065190.1 hypothetical protein [Wolbachia endosymbiont of Drosophila pseudotakahashii]UZE38210.1 hypothetical protein ONI09_04820 [Wolbachia endosymbiont of Drosophila pseudotakahashii]